MYTGGCTCGKLAFQEGETGSCDNTVLGAGTAADADSANQLSVHNDREPALDRCGVAELQDDNSSAGHGIFEGLGRPFKANGGGGLILSDGDAGDLGSVHALETDDMRAIIDNANDHAPAVFARLGLSGREDLFGGLEIHYFFVRELNFRHSEDYYIEVTLLKTFCKRFVRQN